MGYCFKMSGWTTAALAAVLAAGTAGSAHAQDWTLWNGGDDGTWDSITENWLEWDEVADAWATEATAWDPGGNALFLRPGPAGGSALTNTYTVIGTLEMNLLGLTHGGSGMPNHVHHFTGAGELKINSGEIRMLADTTGRARYGEVLFNVPIIVPQANLGLTFMVAPYHTSQYAGEGLLVTLGAANDYTGPTTWRFSGSDAYDASNMSMLTLAHSDALGGAGNVGAANKLVVGGYIGDSTGSRARLRLINNIIIPQDIEMTGSPSYLRSEGNNKITGYVSKGSGSIEVASGALELAGGYYHNYIKNLDGPGTLIISAASTASFRIRNEATLVINASVNGTSRRTEIQAGSTLTGTGTISTPTGDISGTDAGHMYANGGTVRPGNIGSAGTLTISGHLHVGAGGALAFDLSDDAEGTNDLLSFSGSNRRLYLEEGAFLDIYALNGTLDEGTYRLVSFAGSGGQVVTTGQRTVVGQTKQLGELTLRTVPAGYSPSDFTVIYGGGFIDLVVVPEPGSLALLGLAGLLGLRRRRRSVAS